MEECQLLPSHIHPAALKWDLALIISRQYARRTCLPFMRVDESESKEDYLSSLISTVADIE